MGIGFPCQFLFAYRKKSIVDMPDVTTSYGILFDFKDDIDMPEVTTNYMEKLLILLPFFGNFHT